MSTVKLVALIDALGTLGVKGPDFEVAKSLAALLTTIDALDALDPLKGDLSLIKANLDDANASLQVVVSHLRASR